MEQFAITIRIVYIFNGSLRLLTVVHSKGESYGSFT